MIQEGGLFSSTFKFVEYAGARKAKFVSKDAARFEAMVEGAMDLVGETFENINSIKVVLLAVDGTICRRNTLSRLHLNSVVVMRCPNPNDDEDESDESGL